MYGRRENAGGKVSGAVNRVSKAGRDFMITWHVTGSFKIFGWSQFFIIKIKIKLK